MEPDELQDLVAGAILLMAVLAFVSTAYLWSVYWRAHHRTGLYFIFATSATLVTAGAGLLVYPAFLAVTDRPRMEPVHTLIVLGLGLTLAFSMPPLKAGYVYYLRHRMRRRRQPKP